MKVLYWFRLARTRLRGLLRKGSVEREMEEELRFHLRMRAEENVRRGMTPEEAARAARRSFGQWARVKEACRDIKGGGVMETLMQDVQFGIRMLRKNPGFTLVAILTLALGIAATTAIFSVVDAVLLRKLPVDDPARVVVVHNQLPKINLPRTQVSPLQYLDYSRQTDAFAATAAITARNFNLTSGNTPERLQAGRATASFFPLLGVNPVAGRFFTAEEDKFGNQHEVVLSHALWQRLFNADMRVLNSSVQLDGESYQVIGVAPAGLEQLYPSSDLWMPMAFTPRELSEERRGSLTHTMLARLKPGSNIAQAQAIMSGVARNIDPDPAAGFNIEVRSITDEYVGDVRKPLFILLCAVVCVLLISCANIANLLLARASTRTHEIAMRVALGAKRSRIIRQLLTESVLLSLLGGALGVLLALWSMSALLALAPADLPRLNEVRLDLRVLVFSLAVSLVCGLIFGLVPAFAASKTNLANALKEAGRTDPSGSARQRLRGSFVVAEVALALVLLISAGLLVRSFARLLDVRPGFAPHNVLTVRLALPRTQYANAPRVAAFYDALLQRVSALPSVQHAAAAMQPPFTPGLDSSIFAIRDRQAGPNDPAPHANYAYVSSDYFRAMGIPLLQGRNLQPTDMRNGDFFGPGAVAIVDETLAKRYWPNGDALGGGLSWSATGPWATIVGIVGTAQLNDLTEDSKGTFYLPAYASSSTLVVSTAGNPRGLAQAIREQVLAVDKNQPVYDVQTMDERIAATLATRRFAVLLLGLFAGLALVLAAIGLYGVLAYAVVQRTHEIGVRMALGAQSRDVLRLIMRQGMTQVLIGIGLGLLASAVLTRLMKSLLFGVSTTDPLTFVGVSVLLCLVALAACLIPARRATKVDPLIALRYE